jgi:hypothetical protein
MSEDTITVIDTVDDIKCDQLVALFQSAWWTAARTLDDVKRMLRGSDVVVG